MHLPLSSFPPTRLLILFDHRRGFQRPGEGKKKKRGGKERGLSAIFPLLRMCGVSREEEEEGEEEGEGEVLQLAPPSISVSCGPSSSFARKRRGRMWVGVWGGQILGFSYGSLSPLSSPSITRPEIRLLFLDRKKKKKVPLLRACVRICVQHLSPRIAARHPP